jgi:nucleoside-triphosphatase THEP1
MFDAQCDFAAVVYGAGDDPDRLLLNFSEHLHRSGRRVAGIVQLGRAGQAGNSNFGAIMLPGNEVVRMAHDPGSSPFGCRLHAGWVAESASMIADAIDRGVDLVIVNRFGKLEAEGRGFIHLIKQAVSADIPALIAVPEHRFAAWIRYSGGMNVRLACRRAALDRWWQSVVGATGGRRPADTFCEHAK